MTGSGDSASAYPLPLTAEGVTAAWLSAGLRTRNPGVVITQVEPVQVIDGTATKVRLRPAYGPHTRRDGLPDQMCVKGGFGAYREYLGGMGLSSGEVRFFNEIAPLYELARPASYFGLTQTDPVQGIVALEDLEARGVVFARATRPLSVKLAAAGLDTLAALHGQSWADERPQRPAARTACRRQPDHRRGRDRRRPICRRSASHLQHRRRVRPKRQGFPAGAAGGVGRAAHRAHAGPRRQRIHPLPGRIRRHRKAIRRRGGRGDTQRGTHRARPARHVRARRSRGG